MSEIVFHPISKLIGSMVFTAMGIILYSKGWNRNRFYMVVCGAIVVFFSAMLFLPSLYDVVDLGKQNGWWR